MSATDFEQLCPELFDFMLEQLRLYADQKSKQSSIPCHEMILFPILTILTRIYPSSASDSILRRFVPYVLEILLTCHVYTVRRSAAAALNSIVGEDSMPGLFEMLWSRLGDDSRRLLHNALHGVLLLVCYIFLFSFILTKSFNFF